MKNKIAKSQKVTRINKIDRLKNDSIGSELKNLIENVFL